MRTSIVVGFVALATCGCSSSSVTSSNTNDAGAPDATTGGGDAAIDSGTPMPCPEAIPSAGGSCVKTGIICEYGSQADYECNSIATCSPSLAWVITPPSCSLPDGGSACPASASDVPTGQSCSTLAECDYATTRCACSAQQSGPVETVDGSVVDLWVCENPGSGCPTPRPRIGSACSSSGASCNYGQCSLPDGVTLSCMNGAWEPILQECAQ
jgi:hypothetical protein